MKGLLFGFMVKEPGFVMRVTPIKMEFCYKDTFGNTVSPESYERLLLDVLKWL